MLTVECARAKIGPEARVLDLGCGAGRHTFAALRSGAQVVALDASLDEVTSVAGMLQALGAEGHLPFSARGNVVAGDARQLPFCDASFDCVIASEVLEHLDEDYQVMAEIVRVLRPGGLVAVSVPRFFPEVVNWVLSSDYHHAEGGHLRIYRLTQLLARLSGAGLYVRDRHYAHGLHSPYWWLRCVVGVDRDEHRLVAAFHRLLVWEIEKSPALTRLLGWLLDPLIGKSLVLYLTREGPAPTRDAAPGERDPGAQARPTDLRTERRRE